MYAVRKLLATTSFEVVLLTSTDKINWTNEGLVLSKGDPGEWDSIHTYHCSHVTNNIGEIVLFDDKVKLYYSGYGSTPYRIGMATSREIQKYATFWIEIPEISESEDIDYYMYYGNSNSVITTSDGDETFLLFDDFEGFNGETPNVSKWNVIKKGSSNAVIELDGSGNLKISGEEGVISSGNIESISTFDNNVAIHYKRHSDGANYRHVSLGTGEIVDENGGSTDWWTTRYEDGYTVYIQSDANPMHIFEISSGVETTLDSNSNPPLSGNWYEYQYIYDDDGNLEFNNAPEIDGEWTSLVGSYDSTHITSEKHILLTQGEHSSGAGGTSLFDVLFIRKHVSTEPTWAYPGEEEFGEPVVEMWDVMLNLSETGGKLDNVIFGETNVSVDGLDSFDVPKAGFPPQPYLYAWFDAGLSSPYDKLWHDYRDYPDDYEIWNFSIIWAPSDYVTPTEVTLMWETDRVNTSEYQSVWLLNQTGVAVENMQLSSSYTFTSPAMVPQNFQIICSIVSLEHDFMIPLSSGWNLMSLPSDESVDKENISVYYSGSNHTWQEAVDDGTIIGFIYDWSESGQNYGFTDMLVPGQGYWIYAYSACDLWVPVSGNDGDHIADLSTDWNLVGLPYDEPVAKDNLTIYYDGTDYNWTEAVDSSIIIGFIYNWNETGQNYEFTDVLNPGEGYWVYAYYECILKKEVI